MFFDLLTWAAKNPEVPMLMGVALYIWIGLGFVYMKEYWMAAMWFSYAFANAMLAGHTFFRMKNG